MHCRLLLLALVSGIGMPWGCAGRVPPGEIVRKVQFEGNGGAMGDTPDFKLRRAMEQGQNPAFAWLAPARRVALDRDTLDLDAWRLETWLAHRGYFDARTLGWQITTVRPATRRRGPTVVVTGHVQPGEPSVVRSLDIVGIEAAGEPLRAMLRARSPLVVGERFDLDLLDELVSLVQGRLREQGFAYVEVEPQVSAYPEEHAVDVVIEVVPGPACTFGPVTLVGDLTIPESLVFDEVTVEEGAPYRVSKMSETQARLFALGVFGVVNIVPELGTDAQGAPRTAVPIRIELAETLFRQVKVGVGASAEQSRQQVELSGELSHANLFNRLWQLGIGASLGYASVAPWSEFRTAGVGEVLAAGAPTVDSWLRWTVPRFPVRRWRWDNDVGFELGLEEQYRFATPTASTSLNWRISRRWQARFGYRIQYYDYFQSSLPENASLADLRGRDLGLDFSDPYLLSATFQGVEYDSRDDPLYPRRGSYGIIHLTEAGGPVAGQYNFVKLFSDGRIFRPLPRVLGWRQHVTLTGRIAGGVVLPYGSGDRARVPFAERLFVGGSGTVRGWADKHLGPYIWECQDDSGSDPVLYSSAVSQPQPTDCGDQASVGDFSLTYIGGRAALYGGVEARGYWQKGLLDGWGVAVFSDFGRAWDGHAVSSLDELGVRLSQMSVSVGAGIRYQSPVGPIRIDIARRMDHFPMFEAEPRYAGHFALSEAW
ncbi:MAG: hypothetical protein D6798_14145 [Deltaproteobacteria bacterium]|nr:MAG: hypothetical protein D6798_14145 [Deltaproteobacteria bacterium]